MSNATEGRSKIDATHGSCLVSESILDIPTQRLYVISLFVALQAWKVWDVVQLHSTSTRDSSDYYFAIKWICLDAMALFAIPLLRIPWLSFSRSTTLIQVTLLAILNTLLSSRLDVSISGFAAALLKLFYDRELSISEHRVKVQDITRNSSRILGRHTVNILPESTAELNPQNACFCIDHAYSNSVITIPIRLNTTVPILISYSRTDFDDSQTTSFNITGKSLKEVMKNMPKSMDKVWEFPLRISTPGLYQLERIQDSSFLDIRLLKTQVLVVSCPSASLVTPPHLQNNEYRCTGDLDQVSLRITGLPPLRVKYTHSIDGNERHTSIDSVKPVQYSNPIIQSRSFVQNGERNMLRSHDSEIRQQSQQFYNNRDVSWASTQTIDVHLNSSLSTPGHWIYAIEEVQDGCGNMVNYASQSSDSATTGTAIDFDPPVRHEDATTQTSSYQFQVFERPKIALSRCSEENPVTLLEGKSASIGFKIDARPEQAPYHIKLLRKEVLDTEDVEKDTDSRLDLVHNSSNLENITLATRHQPVEIYKSGLYYIQEFSSSYCAGTILEPSTCLVLTPPKPSVVVLFDSIQDKCAGSVGILADLTFTGQPPFYLTYMLTDNGEASKVQRIRIDRSRHQLRFMPEKAGSYVYVFTTLDDANYNGLILKGENYRSSQTIYPLAGAAFVQESVYRCCIGDSVQLPVKLFGTTPLSLTYEIVHGSSRTRVTQVDLNESVHTIATPSLNEGGVYQITLVEIQDGNGCDRPLEVQDAQIEVRRDRPKASFSPIDGLPYIDVTEGSVVPIPLRLTGKSPWSITYEGPNGISSSSMDNANTHLTVLKSGSYRLLGVQDAFCPGVVDVKSSEFEIRHFPKPSLVIPESTAQNIVPYKYSRQSVCEHEVDDFHISLFGAPPFTMVYEESCTSDAERGTKKQSFEMVSTTNNMVIRAKTSLPGSYSYTFKTLSDARYNVETPLDFMMIEQKVRSLPEAAFLQVGKTYNHCLEEVTATRTMDSSNSIPIRFKGFPPFRVTVTLQHELTGQVEVISHSLIQTHTWSIPIPKHKLSIGKHSISIAEVTDNEGCVRKYTEPDKVYIVVSEQAAISPVGSRDEYCVGDRISFSLQGAPPFLVEYIFNGELLKASVNSPVFSRIAERPGNFSIVSLSDSASACKITVNGFHRKIHDTPSVRVSEGRSTVQSIHEGDMAEINFYFHGEPPFTLTYTRSGLDKDNKASSVESHTVSGIWQHKYTVYSAVAGTFWANEIQDAHCYFSGSD